MVPNANIFTAKKKSLFKKIVLINIKNNDYKFLLIINNLDKIKNMQFAQLCIHKMAIFQLEKNRINAIFFKK